MPAEFLNKDGFHITDACREYLLPLIQGESYPPYRDGLPHYVKLKNKLAARLLEKIEA
jgi:6-phosphofructokinase 1